MMLRSVLLVAAPLVVLLGLAGCHPVQVRETAGPDGSGDWKRISCPHLDRRCFATARSICPNGYVFTKEPGRGATSAKRAKVEPATPAPEPAANVTTLPPEETWSSDMYSNKPGTLVVRCASGARPKG